MATATLPVAERGIPAEPTGTAEFGIRYRHDSAFQRDLQRRVRACLPERGSRANIALFGHMLLAGLWFDVTYVLLVFAPLPPWAVVFCTVSLGLAIAGLLMIVIHTAAHYAVSHRRVINDGLAWITAVPLAVSPEWWEVKHNGLHHRYTNVVGFDDDLDIGRIARVSAQQPWRPWHRFQHVYSFLLTPFLYLNMMFVADLRFIVRGKVGARTMQEPTVRRAARLLAKKLGGVTVLLVVAFTQRPAISVITVAVVAALIAGEVIALVFQVQHCVQGTVFPRPNPDTGVVEQPWFVAQAEGAADFATKNRMLTWYTGSLNYHIEHHLFPRVPHNQLPQLRTIVRQTCDEYGVHQVEFPSLHAALRSHYQFLKRMGARPDGPTTARRCDHRDTSVDLAVEEAAVAGH